MVISVKDISLSIDSNNSKGWNITIDGESYHMSNFSIYNGLLSPSKLNFTLTRDPAENANDPLIKVCGNIVGKEVSLFIHVDHDNSEGGGDVEFRGFITNANGNRSDTEYYVYVEASTWDALLDDSPNCKSFEDMTLQEIVEDVLGDYTDKVDPIINPRFQETIPYCVQYNETDYQFLQRLAQRYGEWLYNSGRQMVFGQLDLQDAISLGYPSKEVPSYSMDVRVRHVSFSHLASSYNANAANQKEGIDEMQLAYNDISEQAFQTSQQIYTKPTLQNLHSGGYARADREDSRETILNISTKTQARGQKAGLQTFSGTSYSPGVKIGSTLNIADNYIEGVKRNSVQQVSILITTVVHHFSDSQTYANTFSGIPEKCDYPPYSNSDVYPQAPPCRATVTDNEDPNGLGRVRVQFDWQAEQDMDMMTPWLRIAQPYAGGGKGFSFIPEKGEEVMVSFEGDNAERPFINGTMYNGEFDVDNKWVANSNSHNQVKAIRTRNGHTIEVHDEGNDGYIRIYDNLKENYILTFSTDRKLIMLESTGNIELYAKNDIIMKAGHDMKIKVGNDRTLDVGHDDMTSVKNDQSTQVGNDQSLQVGNDQEKAVGHNNSIQIDGDQMIDVKGNKDERIANTNYLSAKDYREEIDNEVVVLADSQQYKSSVFTKIDGGKQADIKASIVKVN